jgi:hypothetical protein
VATSPCHGDVGKAAVHASQTRSEALNTTADAESSVSLLHSVY